MPETIVHQIDDDSPLMPPPSWLDNYRSTNATSGASPSALTSQMKMSLIAKYFSEAHVEVVAVLEGIEATTACMVQKLGSYCHQDIDFDAAFEQCVTRDKATGFPKVDFDKFDETVPVDVNSPPFYSSG
jgi:hypothetical protein